MVPPKKDVFADLFQLANSSSRGASFKNASLIDQQQQQHKGTFSYSENPKDPHEHEDSLSRRKGSSKLQGDDSFILVDELSNGEQAKPKEGSIKLDSLQDGGDYWNINDINDGESKPELPSRRIAVSDSLLDEDFVDVCPLSQHEVVSDEHVFSGKSDRKEKTSEEEFHRDLRDTTLAQLVEVGFSVEKANNAIDRVGLDLQSCINYLLEASERRNPHEYDHRQVLLGQADLGAAFSDLSNDFLNKASLFFNKSRDAIMKNVENFQHQKASPSFSEAALRQEALSRKSRSQQKMGGSQGRTHAVYTEPASSKPSRTDKVQALDSTEENIDAFKKTIEEPSSRASSAPSENGEGKSNTSEATQYASDKKSPKIKEEDLLGILDSEHGSGTKQQGKAERSLRRGHSFTLTALNEFQRSDYETSKAEATRLFTVGDYPSAILQYNRATEVIPPTHELCVVLHSNLALAWLKVGNYKFSRDHCDKGLSLLTEEDLKDREYTINEKPLKEWHVKLLSRKADSLEKLELFHESLKCYEELINVGVCDHRTIESKRRLRNIINPVKKKPSPAEMKKEVPVEKNTHSSDIGTSHGQPSSPVKKKENQQEENTDSQMQDEIREKVYQWSSGKEDNLRTLLTTLPDILPLSLGFPFLSSNRITLNDVMLPKKVKMSYLKVITSLHPDKLSGMSVRDKLLCENVFIVLNKSWGAFKSLNGLN